MNEFIDFISSNTVLAYITALLIFFVTICLLVRRLIGFMISLLLLAFALISGLAIANYDLFREILVSFKYDPAKTHEDKLTHFKNQFGKAFDELKTEFSEQKEKLEAMYNAYHSTPTPQESEKK